MNERVIESVGSEGCALPFCLIVLFFFFFIWVSLNDTLSYVSKHVTISMSIGTCQTKN